MLYLQTMGFQKRLTQIIQGKNKIILQIKGFQSFSPQLFIKWNLKSSQTLK